MPMPPTVDKFVLTDDRPTLYAIESNPGTCRMFRERRVRFRTISKLDELPPLPEITAYVDPLDARNLATHSASTIL